MRTSSEMPLVHKVLRPRAASEASKPPLIVLLHGSGGDEDDLLSFGAVASEACGGAVVASLRAPYSQLGGFAWFHGNSRAPPAAALETEIGSSAEAVVRFLDAAPAAFGTDPARSCLFGFSQGATIGWVIALMRWPRPDLLASLCLISGRAMPDLLVPATSLGKRVMSSEVLASRPRVFAAHGTADCTTPVELGQQSVSLGRTAGLLVDVVQHDQGHTITIELMAEVGRYMKASFAATEPAPPADVPAAPAGAALPPAPPMAPPEPVAPEHLSATPESSSEGAGPSSAPNQPGC